MKQLFTLTLIIFSLACYAQDTKPNIETPPSPPERAGVRPDSIHVKPSPTQAEILKILDEDAKSKATIANEAALKYKIALLMLLNLREEEIDKLEFKNGVFIGIKKPK